MLAPRHPLCLAVAAALSLPLAAPADPGPPPSAPSAAPDAVAASRPTPPLRVAQAGPSAPAASPVAGTPWLPGLEPLVAEALARNPEVLAALRERDAARNRVLPAGALDDPMLEAGIVNLPAETRVIGREDMTMKMIGLGQKFPYPGKRDLRRGVAERDAEAVGHGYRETANRVLRDLAVAWIDVALTSESERIVTRSRASLEQLLKSIEARYTVGQGSQAEVLKAQTQLTRMAEELVRVGRERSTALAEMNRVLARPGLGAPAQVTLPGPDAARIAPPTLIDTLQEVAYRQRPQLLALSSLAARNERALALARKDTLPDFDVKLSYGQRNSMPDGIRREDMVTFTVAMNLPVWRETKIEPRIAEAQAMREQALAMLAAQQQEVTMRLHHEIGAARQNLRSYRLFDGEILPQARLTLESAATSYRVGRAEFMTLLDSQMAVFEYERARIAALAGHHKALAEIDFLTGRLAETALGPAPQQEQQP